MNDKIRTQLKDLHEQFKARWRDKIRLERAAADQAQYAGEVMTTAINLVSAHYKEIGATEIEVHPLIREGKILGFGVNYINDAGGRRAADILLEPDDRAQREVVKLFQN